MEGSFSLALTILAVQRGFPLSWRSYLSFLPLGSLLGWSSIFSSESGGTFWDIQIKSVLGWNILRCSIVPWPSRQAGGENGVKLVSLRAESFCQTFSGQVQHFEHKNQYKKSIGSISLFLSSMSKLLYLWRMKILWGQFPSSGICSVHKGGRKVCISFEDWETPYELFLLPPLCLLLIHPTLSNNQHTPELCWNKESNGEKNFFDETKFEHITPLPASYKHCCCACFFLHLDFTSNIQLSVGDLSRELWLGFCY